MTGRRTRLRLGAALAALLAAALGAPAATAQQPRPRVECSLERTECFEGETIQYVVEVLDVADAATPELGGAADFDLKSAGSRSLNSTNVEVRNGRMTRVDRFGTQYRYALTPKRAGKLVVPAPKVTADGKQLLGQPLELAVRAPDSQDLVRMAIDVTPAAAYPIRPVTVRLRVFVKRIAGGESRDPIATLAQLDPPQIPMLQIPWFDPPPGLATGDTGEQWLAPHQLRARRGDDGGFAINDRGAAGVPSLLMDDFFGGSRYALFDLEGRPATAADVAGLADLEGHADDYFVYHLDRVVWATRSGAFELGPASFKSRLIDSLQGRRVTLKDLFAVAKPVLFTAKELPTAGRPASFCGGIGSFRIEAAVAPTKAHVGDPLTLTVSVTAPDGPSNLADLGPPPLAQLPEFSHAFKVYDASSETKGGARVFTWSLRPLAATVKAVPPIAFSWFNAVREQYVEAATEPLPIEVAEATRLDAGAIVNGGAPDRGDSPALSAHAGGLFQHDTDPRHLGDERVAWKAHAAAAVGLPLVTLAGLATLGSWQRRRSDPRAQRRRSAAARARARLAQAATAAGQGDALATADALRDALCGVVADAAELAAAGLTARETKDAIARLGVAQELADRAGAALAQWESLRYTGGAVAAASLAQEGTALVERVVDALARGGRLT